MTLEQRLREELQWSADCITCDPNGRLEEVVSKARHRRRVQLVVTSALVVAVVGARHRVAQLIVRPACGVSQSTHWRLAQRALLQ